MRKRAFVLTLATAALSACAGSGGPRPLAYAVPASPEASYIVGDTISIALAGLGQSLQINARSAGTYRLRFASAGGGVRVTASVVDLTADVAMPGSDPISMDESAFQGDFVFDLDARGHPTALTSPEPGALGAQVFSAAIVGHALFPRLPGGAASVGDSWADTTTFREEREAGVTELLSALTYTVDGESQMGGRDLLHIGFAGTATVTQNVNMDGAQVALASTLELQGTLQWDRTTGMPYSTDLTMTGPGTVRTPLMPGMALPTRVTWQTRVRLQDR